jgi:hypothetical protein
MSCDSVHTWSVWKDQVDGVLLTCPGEVQFPTESYRICQAWHVDAAKFWCVFHEMPKGSVNSFSEPRLSSRGGFKGSAYTTKML